MTNSKLLNLIALGLAGSVASVASAQCVPQPADPNAPYLINISGATLLENFLNVPAGANDFIDIDRDCIAGSINGVNESLAPAGVNPSASQYFHIQYRVVGSVNGFSELLNYGQTFLKDGGDASGTNAGVLVGELTPTAYHNSVLYVRQTAPKLDLTRANTGNPGAAPVRCDDRLFLDEAGTVSNPRYLSVIRTSNPTPSTFQYDPTPVGGGVITVGGIRIDIAPLDVPTFWAVNYDNGTPTWNSRPTDAGYGNNDEISRNTSGSTTGFGGLSNKLPDLGNYNFNVNSADSNTIFDTPLAWAPITPMINLGVGRTQIKASELQYAFVTGRLPNGENLVVATRDVGSGTRNGFMNTLGIDPSWGMGDNIGGLSTVTTQSEYGANFSPTNKGSNGLMESIVFNHRLALGYVGAERGVNGGWLVPSPIGTPENIRAEVLAVQNDHIGGTQYSRPDIDDVLDNTENGFILGGPAVLASIGDPRNQNERGGTPGNNNPRMRNKYAAAYLNNISKSIINFVSVPADVANVGSPGELLATRFILSPAQDFIIDPFNSPFLMPNPNFLQVLQDDARSRSVLGNAVYDNYNLRGLGRVPTRSVVTGTNPYADGVVNGANYVTFSGTAVTYNVFNTAVMLRNKIAGDFSGNGLRDSGDITELARAINWRLNGAAWSPANGTGAAPAAGGISGAIGSNIVVEIIGDFDGNGVFNKADARYFADGLALYSGVLNRKKAFTDLDNAWAPAPGNFFGYAAHSTGFAYKAGDARADVANAAGTVTRGFAPTGADNLINAADITYISAQWHSGTVDVANGIGRTPVSVDWANDLTSAELADLSADVTGDLVVNYEDTLEVVHCILGTTMTDFDLDGTNYLNGDAEDIAAFAANENLAGGFAQGDANGDGLVNSFDLCVSDVNLDGVVDFGDFLQFFNYYDVGNCRGDIAGTGDGSDFSNFLAFFNGYDVGC